MAFVIETPNPLEPLKSTKSTLDEYISVRNLVQRMNPQTGEFPVPTVCFINGQPALRAEWGYIIQKNDVVHFLTVVGYASLIIAIIAVVLVIAVSLIFMLNQPKVPGEDAKSDAVFSAKGQNNAIRVGEPIEVCYGRNRLYPSFASNPYYEYRDNDQFAFNLFCLGQGEYDISAIQINDSPIASFQEVQYQIYIPGQQVTLFPTAVFSATEASGQTLFGSNEPEYIAPGWIGPFSANPNGTQAYRIQIDVVLPKGIYRQTKSGALDTTALGFAAQAQLIDNVGAPLGAWFDLTGDAEIVISGATITPQRKSYFADVPLGRYQVRLRRTSLKTLSVNFGNEIQWDGLRSYLTETQNFGNVTLLAVIIRATNNLNNQTQQEFNVICTRKLPIRESGSGWTAPTATRSIVWGLVDLFKAQYGGRISVDTFFDWDALEELDELYTARGEYFDWIFRDPITCWEAARAIGLVGRATPLLAGSLLTLKRDGPLSIPTAVFNQENIIQGTLEVDVKLWDLDEFDSVRVEYTEPATGYKQETVICTLPGGTTDHPDDVRFVGIQDRAHAYHEGLFMRARQRYLRTNVTFETGLEGNIPTYGDLIAVVSDIPNWGAGGFIVQATRGAGDIWQLYLSEPVDFVASREYQIMLRGRTGDVIGPFDALETSDRQQVVIHSAEDFDFMLDGRSEPMLFLFGESGLITRYLKTVMVEPSNTESIRVTAVNDNALVHSFDSLTPPGLTDRPYAPVPPSLPIVLGLTVTQIDAVNFIMQVSWTAAFGAQYYVVQTSTDGIFWRERLTTTRTSIEFQAVPGALHVRVAGVNRGQGPWISTLVDVQYIVGLTLAGAWEDVDWEISWPAVLGAASYTVKIYDHSATVPVLKRTVTGVTDLRYIYDYTLAVSDGNLHREMTVTVEPVFPPEEDGGAAPTIDPTSLDLHNDIPSPPIHLGSELSTVESIWDVIYKLFWDVPMEEDLIRIKVWVSPIHGFDPSLTSPVVDFTAGGPGSAGIPFQEFVPITLDSPGMHPVYYWRVGLFDVWGTELGSNLSDEQVIAAYP